MDIADIIHGPAYIIATILLLIIFGIYFGITLKEEDVTINLYGLPEPARNLQNLLDTKIGDKTVLELIEEDGQESEITALLNKLPKPKKYESSNSYWNLRIEDLNGKEIKKVGNIIVGAVSLLETEQIVPTKKGVIKIKFYLGCGGC